MGLELHYGDGQTPLDEDEQEALLIKSLSSRSELDEFEQQNIQNAMLWLRSRKIHGEDIITEKFICELHRRMFADIWKWAGEFRKTNKNIGIDKFQIPVALRQLLDDCRYWLKHKSFSPEEIAVRFKHRIVVIHCFCNGNGRHSRLMADVMLEKIFHLRAFTWGAANLVRQGDPRNTYLKALKKADSGDYAELLAFARS